MNTRRKDILWPAIALVVALLVALLGCWKQSRLVARWALTLAMAGLILYAYQPAAVAALVSAMLLARINARERGEGSELAV